MLDGAATDGQLMMGRFRVREGKASPFHLHCNEDEVFLLISGTALVWCGEERHELAEGGVVYLPRGVPHAYRITSPEADLLMINTPAGIEGMLRATGRDMSTPRPPGFQVVPTRPQRSATATSSSARPVRHPNSPTMEPVMTTPTAAPGRAVRYDHHGDVDVLQVVDVPAPTPGPGQILVRVLAAGLNPGEIAIRVGALLAQFPSSFPSGQGTDLAGVVEATGTGVTAFAAGDEVLDWVRAGSLFVAGVTALAAVRALDLQAWDTVAVSGAAGGVGSLAVQLARRAGARVLGIAGPANHDWLRSVGVEPVAYGDGLADRVRALAPNGVTAFVDTHGDGYVDLAVEIGVAPERIDTIIDFAAAGRVGARTDGSAQGSTPESLTTIAEHVAWGRIVMPVTAVYPLARIHDATAEVAARHARGKVVLSTTMPDDAAALRG